MVKVISCLQCGNCCKSLLKEIQGVSQTLFLFEDEATKLLKIGKKNRVKIKIQPKSGVSKFDFSKPEIIFSYQFDHDTCPFFNKKTSLCSIYDHRPAACRAYPVEHVSPFVIDRGCSWVKEKTNNLSSIVAILPDDILIEVQTILNWINFHQNILDGFLFWDFDLTTKKWILNEKENCI